MYLNKKCRPAAKQIHRELHVYNASLLNHFNTILLTRQEGRDPSGMDFKVTITSYTVAKTAASQTTFLYPIRLMHTFKKVPITRPANEFI